MTPDRIHDLCIRCGKKDLLNRCKTCERNLCRTCHSFRNEPCEECWLAANYKPNAQSPQR